MSNTITADLRMTLYADPEYSYEIFTGDMFGIRYIETQDPDNTQDMHFASLAEMEVVAKTMLKIVKASREISE